MKKIVLLLALVITSLVSMAHIPTQVCSATGWFTYLWSDLGHATSVEITWGHGHHSVNNGNGYDTIIYNLNLRPVTSFQAPVGQDVTFTFNDGYQTDFNVKLPSCGNLPVLLTDYKASSVSPGVYSVIWTTQLESNNDHFTIQAATDTGTWKTVAIVKSFYADGDGSIPHNYGVLVDADSNTVVEAGFKGNCFLLYLAIIAVFLPILLRRLKKGTGYWIILLMLATTSCSKTNDFNPPVKTYKYFRIVQTDKDGTSVNSPVMVVNN